MLFNCCCFCCRVVIVVADQIITVVVLVYRLAWKAIRIIMTCADCSHRYVYFVINDVHCVSNSDQLSVFDSVYGYKSIGMKSSQHYPKPWLLKECIIPIVTYSVSKKNPPWGLVAIFPKSFGIFQTNFTCLLGVPIYARVWIFIQLPATLMKLCHIKRDHPVHIMCAKCPPSTKTHFLTFFPNS